MPEAVEAPPPREQRSLFGDILDWMLAPLLLLWPMSVVLTWLVAQGLANQPFDRELAAKVRLLAHDVEFRSPSGNPGEARFALAPGAVDFLRPDEAETIWYQVTGSRGERLAGDGALEIPSDEDHAPPGEVRFRDETLHGIDVRVGYMWVPG